MTDRKDELPDIAPTLVFKGEWGTSMAHAIEKQRAKAAAAERARIVAWLRRDDVNAKTWGASDGPWCGREFANAIENGAHHD